MTATEKVARVKMLLGNDPNADTATVTEYLAIARDAVIAAMYPYGNYPLDTTLDLPEVPLRYQGIQCELAARYYSRTGARGEVVHNENGINRTFDSPDDKDLLRKISPIVKVV